MNGRPLRHASAVLSGRHRRVCLMASEISARSTGVSRSVAASIHCGRKASGTSANDGDVVGSMRTIDPHHSKATSQFASRAVSRSALGPRPWRPGGPARTFAIVCSQRHEDHLSKLNSECPVVEKVVKAIILEDQREGHMLLSNERIASSLSYD
jgi:hypothetical protein